MQKKIMSRSIICSACLVLLLSSCGRPEPPGQAAAGYGSSAGYISGGYSRESVGADADGSRAWYYVPDILKHGATAPDWSRYA